ncbi:hypothetical protein J6590_020045 [Homalodisca vitripennis]|nr:hypothetical protein J6590_020045 [Homalodisca vitripennis]
MQDEKVRIPRSSRIDLVNSRSVTLKVMFDKRCAGLQRYMRGYRHTQTAVPGLVPCLCQAQYPLRPPRTTGYGYGLHHLCYRGFRQDPLWCITH